MLFKNKYTFATDSQEYFSQALRITECLSNLTVRSGLQYLRPAYYISQPAYICY